MQCVRDATGGADSKHLNGIGESQRQSINTKRRASGANLSTARARLGRGTTPTIAAAFRAPVNLLK